MSTIAQNKNNHPLSPPSVPASSQRMQAEAANPKEVPSTSISLTQPGSHGSPAGISGPTIRASAQQEVPQGNFQQSAVTKTSRAQDCPVTRRCSETPF